MSIRTILVPINGENEDKASLETALEVAKTFQAHVECLYVSPDITSYIYPDIGMPNPALGGYVEAFEQTSQARLERARTLFTSLSNQHGVPVEERLTAAEKVSSYLQLGNGDMEEHIVQQGKLSDLIVMQGSFAPGNSPYYSWAVTALFETGKPLLLTPVKAPAPTMGKTVVIAWNNSVEVSRALHYAIPFLRRAENICILAMSDNKGEGVNVEAVSLYLTLHGITAKTRVSYHKESPSGIALITEARRANADLLVMGAFTHTRLRQMIMGGMTSYMLEHTEFPVLMVH